jgi:caa(3)-type oxidase subunit IV
MRKKADSAVPEGVWLAPLAAWVAILLALALNVALAFAPLAASKPFATFAVACAQVVAMGLVFMRLNRASPLVRLTAVAGFFWLAFLFVMSGADYFTRR